MPCQKTLCQAVTPDQAGRCGDQGPAANQSAWWSVSVANVTKLTIVTKNGHVWPVLASISFFDVLVRGDDDRCSRSPKGETGEHHLSIIGARQNPLLANIGEYRRTSVNRQLIGRPWRSVWVWHAYMR